MKEKLKLFSSVIIITLLTLVACESEKVQVNAPVQPISYDADINLNGGYNEIADAVLFSNYFVYGKSVFTVDSAKQIAATDVNKDGNPLSVADLVYLVGLANRDSLPVPNRDTLNFLFENKSNYVISAFGDTRIGAALVVFEGSVEPDLLVDNMEMKYVYDGNNTIVLVWSPNGESFIGDFLETYADIISVEMATIDGQPILLLTKFPESIYLFQNDPNPFSYNTRISFLIQERTEVDLIIVSNEGYVALKHSRTFEPSLYSFFWSAFDDEGYPIPRGTYNCYLRSSSQNLSIQMEIEPFP